MALSGTSPDPRALAAATAGRLPTAPQTPTSSGYGAPPRPASDRAPSQANASIAPPPTTPDPYSFLPAGFADALKARYAPDQELLNGQAGRGQARADYLSGHYDAQGNFANRDYQNSLGQLGLRQADLGIDRSTGQSLLANLQRAVGLNNQGLAENLANIDRRLGTDTASQNMDWRDRIQQLSSARIAGGFGSAPGYDIGGQQINQANANQLAALNNAALYARQQANLSNTQSNLGIENQQINQRADLSKLDNAFKGLGLQGDALKIGLDQKLADLGLSRFTNAQQLEDLLQSTDAKKLAIGQQITEQLAPYFGVKPPTGQ